MKKTTALFFLVFLFSVVHAQDLSLYEKKKFMREGDTLLYRILYPLNYDAKKAYPLIIVLHGSGQRGKDNEIQLMHGGNLFLKDSIRKNYPAIVIFPQCPATGSWSYFQFKFDMPAKKLLISFPFREQPLSASRLVKELADSLTGAGLADKSRVYIGGLSMGGFGTFDMIARYPGYFAAAFPICGGGDTAMAERIAGKTAVWIFHGGADPLVNVDYSRLYFHALQYWKADVLYTEYPGVRHNSWDNAFAEKDLVGWLFSKKTILPIVANGTKKD
jgi:predicted peptidase